MTTIHDRLTCTNIARRLRLISHRFGPECDEVLQQITLDLIERAYQRPTLAEATDAYLLRYARWKASHFRERSGTYDRYVECEPYTIPDPDEDTEAESLLDTAIAANCPSPEEAVIRREVLTDLGGAIADLPRHLQRVAILMAEGYRPGEIAKTLRRDKATVSRAIGKVRRALDGKGLTSQTLREGLPHAA